MKQRLQLVEAWFYTIQDPTLRKRALDNLSRHTRCQKVKSLSEAILYGFSWSDSPEGHDYWEAIYTELIRQNN